MLLGHQKRSREEGGCLFLVLVTEALSIDQTVSQFVSQRQPSSLQRKLVIDDNHWQARLPLSSANKAGKSGHAVRQRNGQDFEALLFQKLGHVWDRIEAEFPRLTNVFCQLLGIRYIVQLGRAWQRALPFGTVEVEDQLDLQVALNPFKHFRFNVSAVLCGGVCLRPEFDA